MKTSKGALLSAMAVVLSAMLSGCMPSEIYSETLRYTGDAGITKGYVLQRKTNLRIHRNAQIFVARIKEEGAEGSYNQRLSESLEQRLSRYFANVHGQGEGSSLKQAFSLAHKHGSEYLIVPQIFFFEDNIGDWGTWRQEQDITQVGPDKLRINLNLYSVADGKQIDNAYVSSRSGWATFFNGEPADLIAPPMDDYAMRLAGIGK